MCHVFSPSRAVLGPILRDEYLTSAVKYSSRKIALKTARDGEKNMPGIVNRTQSNSIELNLWIEFD